MATDPFLSIMRSPIPFLALALASLSWSQDTIQHKLEVELHPETHSIEVIDVITLPKERVGKPVEFTLNGNLTILESPAGLQRIPTADTQLATYKLAELPAGTTLTLEYRGVLHEDLSNESDEYTRGFRETTGIIGKEGVYLAGQSHWIPKFSKDDFLRFEVSVFAPADWQVISQGRDISGGLQAPEGRSVHSWASGRVMEQVYLVGGPLHVFRDESKPTAIQVYLHAEDPGLASKYLRTTDRYLTMYREMLGPYPYSKFALVENFWETGYGMPSFTLLGEEIIRMPFILHSSFPHEILHNWWGNSVFVDYESGNWCEGLTAYLADHLVQEQRSKGHEYRRNTLQKFRDYVREGRDFPLRKFSARHDAASEAVGYGKSLMVFHMLREQWGERTFREGLNLFYQRELGKRASWDSMRSHFERVAGQDLEPWFNQWLDRTGAPTLAIQDARIEELSGESAEPTFKVHFTLKQTQAGEPYNILVPIAVQTASKTVRFTVELQNDERTVQRTILDRPLAIAADPDFDVFRLLDSLETPPTIGQLFGSPSVLAVLPSNKPELIASYRGILEKWQTNKHRIEFVLDTDLQDLPTDKSVWLLDLQNTWAKKHLSAKTNAFLSDSGTTLHLGAESADVAGNSFVNLWRNPNNTETVIGCLHLGSQQASSGMQRKLPHYGKYSYLAFEGNEPTNFIKGQWPTSGSPLYVDLRGESTTPLPALEPRLQGALGTLPPEFSAQRMMRDVRWLADPARQGRGLGSEGLAASAEYIAERMQAAGLQPGGDNGTWFQEFMVPEGPDGQPTAARNVIGLLPGKDKQEQSFVIGAHYDHLGMGWPDVHTHAKNTLHPGADDNASGVAVLLELASNLVAEGPRDRTLVVCAFSAEEAGLFGSRHYVANPYGKLEDLRGAINLDAVGRLGQGSIQVHGSGTADEWQHIFRGAGFVTGIPNQMVPAMIEGSDHKSFIEAGVPAVHLFTGANGDYHRPTDTVDKLDPRGLVKVAAFTKEGVVYMLKREDPLTIQIQGSTLPSKEGPQAPKSGSRKVSFGSMPDFSYSGSGVRFASISEGSPAGKAGLLEGDVLTAIGDTEIADLKAFSDHLKTLKPGQTVQVIVERSGEEIEASVTVVAR